MPCSCVGALRLQDEGRVSCWTRVLLLQQLCVDMIDLLDPTVCVRTRLFEVAAGERGPESIAACLAIMPAYAQVLKSCAPAGQLSALGGRVTVLCDCAV